MLASDAAYWVLTLPSFCFRFLSRSNDKFAQASEEKIMFWRAIDSNWW